MGFHYDSEAVSLREHESGNVDLNLHATLRDAEVSAKYKAVDDGGTAYVVMTTVVTRDDGAEVTSTTFLSLEQAEAMRDTLTAALHEGVMAQAVAATSSAEGSEVSS